jgi:uncharacterized protein (TIGR02145 family)
MKKIIFSFIAVVLYTNMFSQTDPIVVTVLNSQPGSGITNIQYEFSGTYLSYDITVEVSFDSDPYQAIPEADLSGDLRNVAPGVRNIVWNGSASFTNQYSEQTRIRITATPDFTCGDQITDIEGHIYNTVLIGTQCWMKDNLNIGIKIDHDQVQTNNSIIEKYCYGNLESNCNIYGGLYMWREAMQYTTQEGTQGICPDGWHVPSSAEWGAMTGYVMSQSGYGCDGDFFKIGKSLAAQTHWNLSSSMCAIGNDLNANNATGFSCLPGGYRTINYFDEVGICGYWWTSSLIENSITPFIRYLRYNNFMIYYQGDFYYNADWGYSVRCLRDY